MTVTYASNALRTANSTGADEAARGRSVAPPGGTVAIPFAGFPTLEGCGP